MEVARPALRPDPALDRDAMERLQRKVATTATFVDDFGFDPGAVAIGEAATGEQTTFAGADAPLVAGVDQSFGETHAASAVIVLRGGEVVERATGRAPLEMPYVPGLLSFREAPAIADALGSLTVDPDLLVVDGSGRIHFRQAGIATHVGVLFEVPAVGVAKNLLCGRPRDSLEEPLPEGARVAIEADDSVEPVGEEDPDWPVIGYAVQSRQYDDPASRHVNPLYVSPGHRVSAAAAAGLTEALSAGYKLPEPTRLADAHADTL